MKSVMFSDCIRALIKAINYKVQQIKQNAFS